MSVRPAAVPDTNVAISAFLSARSLSAHALASLRVTHRLLGSPETIVELRNVLMRDKFSRIPVAERQALLDDFIDVLEIVVPQIEVAICRDPDDNKFLTLAVSSNADLILSGDKDLLTLHPFRGIDILSPNTYLAQRS